ncbi:MAG: hypothetical protein JO362_04955 [Streptomycetaceae bacterium]|nr:hypothetical protein [Streptomycetaceae bacterium]
MFTRRHLVGTALGAALLAAAPAPAFALAHVPAHTPASADDEGNSITVDQVGHLAPDGTITLAGSYRCSGGGSGDPVFVSSNLRQGHVNRGIGGTQAICDGTLHRWRNSEDLDATAYAHGQARVTGTLMTFTYAWGIPLPRFLAVQKQHVTLVPDPR